MKIDELQINKMVEIYRNDLIDTAKEMVDVDTHTGFMIGQIVKFDGEYGVFVESDGYSGIESTIYTPDCEVGYLGDISYRMVETEKLVKIVNMSDIPLSTYNNLYKFPVYLPLAEHAKVVYWRDAIFN